MKKIRHITSEVKCRHVDMLLLIAIIVAVSLDGVVDKLRMTTIRDWGECKCVKPLFDFTQFFYIITE